MAIVAPARSAVEADAGHGAAILAQARSSALIRTLSLVALGWYGLTLVAESARRSALPAGVFDDAIRFAGAGATLLAVVACVATWLVWRHDAGLLLATTLAAMLVPVRVLSSALLAMLDLSTLADLADVGLGLLVFGCLVWAATAALGGVPARPQIASRRRALYTRIAEVTSLVVFGVALSGSVVRAVGASWACVGSFPDCNGLGVLPFGRDPQADVQLYHRLLSYVALALVAWLAIEAVRSHAQLQGLGRSALVLLASTIGQGVLGGVSVSYANPPLMQVLHMTGALATWTSAVVLVVLSHRSRVGAAGPSERTRRWSVAQTASAYVQLTKPRVMSLLLVTTTAAMVIAARGLPDLGVFFATLLGGALMSGGAGAINHYVDRDIDPLMGRTAWRPIPSGVISPRRALWFGVGLAVLASAVFVAFVNVLACCLALVGLLGYVFIYTLWLKRTTPSNIVIGGAAGAIPPLVGWAAVTNEISSLTAWYLFAIIFFWTPPHFWALSLLIRKHYERAGIPMLPVVRGDEETRRQIVLYSVLLVVLTLVLSPFGMMGRVYFGAALVLGALFIRDALGLWRQATPQAARRLYLYSMLYLFALFAAMAVDRVVSH